MKNKKYFIKIVLLITFLFLTACSNSSIYKWESPKTTFLQRNHLKIGDILILNKKFNPYSLFGHSAMIVDKNIVGEYPAYGHGYIKRNIIVWIYENIDRDIIILRSSKLNLSKRKKIIVLAKKYSKGSYSAFVKKDNIDKFYCSSWIWRIYNDLGIDLLQNKNFYVLPYDFLISNELEQVPLENLKKNLDSDSILITL